MQVLGKDFDFLTCLHLQKVSEIEPEAAGSDVVLTSTLESGVDVVIDFSSPQGTLAIAKRAEELGIALVIGTTAKVNSSHKTVLLYCKNQCLYARANNNFLSFTPLHSLCY